MENKNLNLNVFLKRIAECFSLDRADQEVWQGELRLRILKFEFDHQALVIEIHTMKPIEK